MWAGTINCNSRLSGLIQYTVSCGTHHACILYYLLMVQVTAKEQAEEVGSREQAIVQVMVDLLLDMEKITVNQGLVYVVNELESYSVSGECRGSSRNCVMLVLEPVWFSLAGVLSY